MKKPQSVKYAKLIWIVVVALLFNSTGVDGQDFSVNPDTLSLITIEEVVITANRFDNKLLNSGASVEVIRSENISKIPAQNFSNILSYIPGIYAPSNDGMGLNPQVNIRGFFGGGEAEYLTVLVDDLPINDLESGLVNWNQVPLNQIERIELLKGGSSTLYGDAAMGGVINIRTIKEKKEFTTANIGYGSFNSYTLGAAHGGKVGKGNYELFANNNATNGFRTHSNWKSINFGGKVKLPLSRNSTLALSTFNQILNSDDAGYLFEENIAADREQSLSYFRADGKDLQKYLANLELNTKINPTADLSINLSYQHNNKEQIRTYGQIPNILIFSGEGQPYPSGIYDTTVYGDTKKRTLTTDQINLAMRVISDIPDSEARITGGIEMDYGHYDSKYADIFRGFGYDYTNNYFPWDSLDAKGTGYRFKSAAYLNGEIKVAEPLTLLAGIRYDFISDVYDGQVPDSSINKYNSALSPKLALSLSTGKTENYSGSIFVSYSHAFKAPTIDQRTDLKSLNYYMFVQAGPVYYPVLIKADPFSNAGLKPQNSQNYEIGTYQFFKFSESMSGEINLAGYLIKVKDEIDFDLQTQKYKNLIDTEHTGLETSLRLKVKKDWNGFINYNYSEVKFSSGENEGKTLKGVPKNVYALGISYSPRQGFGANLFLNGAGGIFLDDENTEKLDGYAVLNTRIDYTFNVATVYLDIQNVFNKSYNSTGYSLDGIKYLYPAMGRFLQAGVNFNF